MSEVKSNPDQGIESYVAQYVETSRGVFNLYNLRFNIITVYVASMFTSVIVSFTFNSPFGCLIGVFGTLVMWGLDYVVHKRQTLFALTAANLEDKIDDLRNSSEITEISVYNMYFNKIWKLDKQSFSYADIKTDQFKYHLFSRGWVFSIITGIMIAALIFTYIVDLPTLTSLLFS